MITLRQRFLGATILLLGLQIASTALAIGSWRQVVAAADREQQIASWRVAVSDLGSAAREQYVHEAHTFIEGGPGHLHHEADTERQMQAALDAIRAMPLDPGLVDAIARDQTLVVAFFREQVAPAAEAGALDQPRAERLHATTEQLTAQLTTDIASLLGRLDGMQADERAIASTATTRAWQATAVLTVGSVILALLVAQALARSVLAPTEALRATARKVVAGESAPQELGEIARVMDEIVHRLGEAEERRVRAERLAALGEMSASIAHELLNPLTVILGELAVRGDPTLEPLRQEADHAKRIVQGLLAFARPSTELDGPIDLPELAAAAVDRLAMQADSRGIRLALSRREGGAPPGRVVDRAPAGGRQPASERNRGVSGRRGRRGRGRPARIGGARPGAGAPGRGAGAAVRAVRDRARRRDGAGAGGVPADRAGAGGGVVARGPRGRGHGRDVEIRGLTREAAAACHAGWKTGTSYFSFREPTVQVTVHTTR
jgi:hypothetical protein